MSVRNGPGCRLSVAVRIRNCQNLTRSSVMVSEDGDSVSLLRTNGDEYKRYYFDSVHGPEVDQEEFYSKSIRPNILGLDKHLTVFAYGQTGAGKTYTMGTNNTHSIDENSGIITRAIKDIFGSCNQFKFVNISFYEIYNEVVFDLLSNNIQDDVENRIPLHIKEDFNRNFSVNNLNSLRVNNEIEALKLLEKGNEIRSKASTAMNTASSRSHAVFSFSVQINEGTVYKINLVDLAGSECLKRTGATGKTQQEGLHINKSLLALGNVVEALYFNKSHVPFRDSSLTKILKESLFSSECETIMIACISPDADVAIDNESTLRYADRAKHIRKKSTMVHKTPFKRPKVFSATPDKFGRLNASDMTPFSVYKSRPPGSFITSTATKKLPSNNDSYSTIGENSFLNQSIVSTIDRSVLSPILRKYKEDLQKTLVDPVLNELQLLRQDLKKTKKPRLTSSPILIKNDNSLDVSSENEITIAPILSKRRSSRLALMDVTNNFIKSPLNNVSKELFKVPFDKPNRRRSARLVEKRQSMQIESVVTPFNNWTILSQNDHNQNILNIINTSNAKVLQALPAIGPKSAFIIQTYRNLHGPFKEIEDVAKVPGLVKSFYKKFITANQITN